MAHTFQKVHLNKPTYCSYCASFIWGVGIKQAYQCKICSYVVHRAGDCKRQAPSNCKISQDGSALARSEHHFISGNPGLRKRCHVCQQTLGFSDQSGGQSCTKCSLAVHQHCLRNITTECDPTFGDLWLQGSQPIIVLINRRSGGGQGESVRRRLLRHLLPEQVFDLADGGPLRGVQEALDTPNSKLLVCGGDGTVCWTLSVLDQLAPERIPPIATLPLGTGNDMARFLKWGPGYDEEPLEPILRKLWTAVVKPMDRWDIEIRPSGEGEIRRFVMNNYFSIGVDAQVALDFHTLREEHPEKFTSRAKNKVIYTKFGLKATSYPLRIRTIVQAAIDEFDINDRLSAKAQGFIVLNIPSYGGGCDLWAAGKPDPNSTSPIPSTDDRQFEVLTVRGSAHLGLVQSGMSKGERVGQGSVLHLRVTSPIAAQVDGEPFQIPPSEITITYKNTVPMLQAE